MSLGVLVRLTIENQSRNKHVESWNIRRLDEGSNPSDSTIKKKETEVFPFFVSNNLDEG